MQARASGNEALGVALFRSMSQPSSRLGMRFRPSQFLHLLPSEDIRQRIQRDPALLFELSWKRMAIRRPETTVLLMQQALETAEGDVSLNKRWLLVRPPCAFGRTAIACWDASPHMACVVNRMI